MQEPGLSDYICTEVLRHWLTGGLARVTLLEDFCFPSTLYCFRDTVPRSRFIKRRLNICVRSSMLLQASDCLQTGKGSA
jgi:hypothetical protein